MRRKGWSELKILRALQQQEERRRAEAAARRAQSQAELQRWREFLIALLDVLPYAGLLLHDYSGRIEEEDIRLAELVSVPLSRIDEEWLGRLSEDVLYEVGLGG